MKQNISDYPLEVCAGGDLPPGLSRSDCILIFSMLLDSPDTLVPFSYETVIGGQPVRSIVEQGGTQLFLALKPRKASASTLWSFLVRATTASIESLSQSRRRCQTLRACQSSMRDVMRCARTTLVLAGGLLRDDGFLIELDERH